MGGASRLGGKIINCRDVCYYWEGIPMLKDFTYNFQRMDKIGIVGRNGDGKSSLLGILAQTVEPDSGRVFKRNDFSVFGWYRIILGIIVLAFFGIRAVLAA